MSNDLSRESKLPNNYFVDNNDDPHKTNNQQIDQSVIDFGDAEPEEITVKIKNKLYILREPVADVVIRWRNAQASKARFNAEGNFVSVGNIADSEPFLLSMCLYAADDVGNLRLNKDGEPDNSFLVPEKQIRKWTNNVQRGLFDKIKEMGWLDEVETADSLKKQIANLQKRLAKVEGDKGEEAVKN